MRNRRFDGRREWGNYRQSHRHLARRIWISAAIVSLIAISCGPGTDARANDEKIQRLLYSGQASEALKLAEQCLHATSPDHDRNAYWTYYLAKAETVLNKSGARASLSLLDAASIPDIPAFRELRARQKLDQAKTKFLLSDFQAAQVLLGDAAKLAEAAGQTGLHANIEFWTANVFATLGDPAAAETAAREGFRLASLSGEDWRKGQALATLGFVRLSQSRFEEALHYFEQQVPLLRPGDLISRAGALNNMAVCHYHLGELDAALSNFQQALAINVKIQHAYQQSLCLGNMGNVYLDRREFGEAKKCFLAAIRLNGSDQANLAKWFSNSARAAIETKDWSAAEEYNNQALQIKRTRNDRRAELYSLRNAALIAQGKGDIGTAESLFTQVIDAGSDDPSPALEAQAGLAELYVATDRPEEAESRFRAALEMVERSRARLVKDEYKLSYVDSQIALSQNYVDFLMSHGKQERALETAEASRARTLCEKLGIDASTRRFSGRQYRQLAESTGSVLVSYWMAPERSYVWVITAKDISGFTLASKTGIAPMVERHRALIENLRNPLESEDSSGSELYQALIAPIQDRLPKGSRVIFIPDGPLYALNFETLPVPGPAKHYLLEDVVSAIAPALNLLASSPGHGPSLSSTRENAAASLLLIGDPESTDELFPALPYAGREMSLVQGHFAEAKVMQFRSRKAVPAAYLGAVAQPFSFIHFTAHAVADREHPLDSAIILSGPRSESRLTASSVMRQPVHARIVTLSACRTAGARTYAGEGLVGFTWAFFHAGARSIIAGLWDVSDESTPKLMDELYTGIMAGKHPADALHAAKLALMRSSRTYSLPYYWAPFQLYIRDPAP